MKAIFFFTALIFYVCCINNSALSVEIQKSAIQSEKNSSTESNTILGTKTGKEIDVETFIKQIEAYLAVNPGWQNKGWMIRATAYSEKGNHNPKNAIRIYNAGVIASTNKKYSEALQHYEKADRLDPGFPWSANNLAWLFATCPEESLRDGKRAIEFARKAIAVQEVEVPDFLGTLAAGYATQGDFDTAIKLCRRSIEMWPSEQSKEMLNCFQRKNVYINSERPPENVNLVSPEGFGKIKWGMSKLDAIEFFQDWIMESNDLVLVDFESDKGYKALCKLHFYQDRLWRVQVLVKNISEKDLLNDFINESFTGTKDFTTAKMTAKGNKPEVILESDETRIKLQFVFWEKEAVIDFTSKKYQNYVQPQS